MWFCTAVDVHEFSRIRYRAQPQVLFLAMISRLGFAVAAPRPFPFNVFACIVKSELSLTRIPEVGSPVVGTRIAPDMKQSLIQKLAQPVKLIPRWNCP